MIPPDEKCAECGRWLPVMTPGVTHCKNCKNRLLTAVLRAVREDIRSMGPFKITPSLALKTALEAVKLIDTTEKK